MAEIVFLGSILLIFHAYFGYPLSLLFLSFFRKKKTTRSPFFPPATIIIAACNEEKRIGEKLENTLDLDYPKEKLQIIVASDGSGDRTNEIVENYCARGVWLLKIPERRGKENAQKEAVQKAKGDILVFTDTATLLDRRGLREIISNFSDPSVGSVSCEDRLLGNDGSPSGEGFYLRYEMWLRRMESNVNSLVGVSGCFFAARKEVCRDFPEDVQSDFRTVLNGMKLGFRGVTDPRALGFYQDVADPRHEFDRKIRTILRGLTVFFHYPELLNILKYRFFSYQYLCHKLLRWLVPFFLLAAFGSNVILAGKSPLFLIFLLAQISFYGLAIWGWKMGIASSTALMKVPVYFLTVNASILIAWWRYLRGQRVVVWIPSER